MPDEPDYLPNPDPDEEAVKLNNAYLAGELPPNPLDDEAEAARKRRLAIMRWAVLGSDRIILAGDNTRDIIGDAARYVVDENLNRRRTQAEDDFTPGDEEEITAADVTVEGELSPPLTPEEREARLAKIKTDVEFCYRNYKKYAERSYKYMLKMGALLIEAKGLVGHRRFMTWVQENFPFHHDTGNGYMRLVEQDFKFRVLLNLVEQGTIQAVEQYIAKRSRRAAKKAERKAYAMLVESRAAHGEVPPKSLEEINETNWRTRRRGVRRGGFQSFRERAAAIKDGVELRRLQRDKLREEARALELPDLNEYRPHEDGSAFLIEVKLPDPENEEEDYNKYLDLSFYVWLPENGHLDAIQSRQEPGKRIGAQNALKYRWIKLRRKISYNATLDFTEEYGEDTWPNIQRRIIDACKDKIEIVETEVIIDTLGARVLDSWARSFRHAATIQWELQMEIDDLKAKYEGTTENN